jgi:hypothetical protein
MVRMVIKLLTGSICSLHAGLCGAKLDCDGEEVYGKVQSAVLSGLSGRCQGRQHQLTQPQTPSIEASDRQTT